MLFVSLVVTAARLAVLADTDNTAAAAVAAAAAIGICISVYLFNGCVIIFCHVTAVLQRYCNIKQLLKTLWH